jgi:hypothetical protein
LLATGEVDTLRVGGTNNVSGAMLRLLAEDMGFTREELDGLATDKAVADAIIARYQDYYLTLPANKEKARENARTYGTWEVADAVYDIDFGTQYNQARANWERAESLYEYTETSGANIGMNHSAQEILAQMGAGSPSYDFSWETIR